MKIYVVFKFKASKDVEIAFLISVILYWIFEISEKYEYYTFSEDQASTVY